jgi:hypothetical protein
MNINKRKKKISSNGQQEKHTGPERTILKCKTFISLNDLFVILVVVVVSFLII